MAARDELIAIEERGWEALATSAEAATAFYDVVLASMVGEPWNSYELSDVVVLTPTTETGIVTYRSTSQRGEADPYTADGDRKRRSSREDRTRPLKHSRMRPPRQVIEAGAWALENGHRALLALTAGRFPRKLGGMQTVELHHTGRRSGLPHSTLLTAPIFEPERVVLIASKGGHPDHPDWYKNLVANPDVELVANGERRAVRARTAQGDERAELWPQVVAIYSGYAGYQRNTDREIPVVILEPRN